MNENTTGVLLSERLESKGNTLLIKKFDGDSDDDDSTEKQRVERLAKVLAKRYVWRTVAGVSLVMGIGCLIMANRLRTDFKVHRRFTKR